MKAVAAIHDGRLIYGSGGRVGQKNKITRRWARRGTRPSAPHDHPTASNYIFGAVCPAEGKGAVLMLPFCNSAAMTAHLAEISAMVEPGKHAALLLDQAGWYFANHVEVPANITLLPLPLKCPELNVMENTCQFTRDNWRSNRAFPTRTPSSTCAATPGTNLSISHGESCPSACAIGRWVMISRI